MAAGPRDVMKNGLYSIHVTLLDGRAGKGSGVILFRDGKILGVISPALSAKELECAAEAKRALASDQPRYSIEQVLGRLDKSAGN